MSYQKHDFQAGAVLLASQLNEMDDEIELLGQKESSLSENFKQALLNCFENVVWVNESGRVCYDALYTSLYPETNVASISAVFNQGSSQIYPTDSLNSLRHYLTVTATYNDSSSSVVTAYTLIGELTEGISTITVEYGGKSTTFDVVVSPAPGVYNVTNNLTNCTTSNTSTLATENTSYSATITPDLGYSLDGGTVIILMGGNDVTSTAYSSGSINIPNVTGDLVITATAISLISSISAVFTLGTDVPIDISSASIVSADITDSGTWSTSTGSSTICIPVTIGKRYSFNWSETDSSVVGTIFRWGFSNTNTAGGQVLSNYYRTSPQGDAQAETEIADNNYLVIQFSNAYASSIISNGYCSVTEINKIYNIDSLNQLKQYLTVTATYPDTSTEVVTNYTLSGTLAVGTDTITVSYGGKTTTFTVNALDSGYLYYWDLKDSLIDRVSGAEAMLYNTTRTSSGVTLSVASRTGDDVSTLGYHQAIRLGNVFGRGKQIEVSLTNVTNKNQDTYKVTGALISLCSGSIVGGGVYDVFGYHYSTTASTQRFGMVNKSTEHWSYNSNTSVGTKTYLDGSSTVKLSIDANGVISIYKSGTELNAVYPINSSGSKPTITNANASYVNIGSYTSEEYTVQDYGGYYPLLDTTITGIRIKNV